MPSRIGRALGRKPKAKGFTNATVLLGQFFCLKMDKDEFVTWMKDKFKANKKQSSKCYWCHPELPGAIPDRMSSGEDAQFPRKKREEAELKRKKREEAELKRKKQEIENLAKEEKRKIDEEKKQLEETRKALMQQQKQIEIEKTKLKREEEKVRRKSQMLRRCTEKIVKTVSKTIIGRKRGRSSKNSLESPPKKLKLSLRTCPNW